MTPKMNRYALTDDYSIPRVINGGWQLSAGHALDQPIDLTDAANGYERLMDMGFDTFDCADIYTGVEDFFGSIIRRRRKAGLAIPQIHTKFVPDLNDLDHINRDYVERIITRSIQRLGVEQLDMVQFHWWDYAVPGMTVPDLNDLDHINRDYVERIITRSIQRLGVEQLDMVQFHWWDYAVPGMTDVAGELLRLKEKGLIRLISTTNCNATALRALLDAGIPIATNQCQYSVLDRRPAMRLEALCRERGVRLIAYGTVAGGFLSEKWLGQRRPQHLENRSLVKYNLVIEDSLRWEAFQGLLTLMRAIGEPLGLSIANVATLYTLSKPFVAAAVIGTRSARHVDGNAALINQSLPPEAIARLDAYLAEFPTVDGDCFDLERLDGSKHRAIMRMNLVNSLTGQ